MEERGRSTLQAVLQSAKSRYERHKDYLIKGKPHEFRAQILLINPILAALGWDVLDPDGVRIEEVAGDDAHKAAPRGDLAKADYALYAPGPVCVGVVEAKTPAVELMTEKRQRKANGYAEKLGSTWVILTNGLLWRGWVCGNEKMGEDCFLRVSLTSDSIEKCCEQFSLISYEAALNLCRKHGA